jgi:hypothetical protein
MEIPRARQILRDELADATVKSHAAVMKLRAVTGSPQNVADVSAEVALARRRVERAIERLTDLIIKKRVPEDLESYRAAGA